jgi:FMN phosphatase YigB (HAD superfamily)
VKNGFYTIDKQFHCTQIEEKTPPDNSGNRSLVFYTAAMIISASRRTDIPAFYAAWFMNRVRAGYCAVPNPFNPRQVSRVSLRPEDVDVIVFWTRNAQPLMASLDELDDRGYRYYFQYTILAYPRLLETKTPPIEAAIETFRRLSERIGPERVIWRYDPIVFSSFTDAAFHRERFAWLAGQLRGLTRRVVISVVDGYRKVQARLRKLVAQGATIPDQSPEQIADFDELMHSLVETAMRCEMEIVSCAEELDLTRYGVRPGKCVDDALIARVFNLNLTLKKDAGQRDACGCVTSRDIGMYDSCLFGCQYCYATRNFARSAANYAAHDPASPSLLGWHEATH